MWLSILSLAIQGVKQDPHNFLIRWKSVEWATIADVHVILAHYFFLKTTTHHKATSDLSPTVGWKTARKLPRGQLYTYRGSKHLLRGSYRTISPHGHGINLGCLATSESQARRNLLSFLSLLIGYLLRGGLGEGERICFDSECACFHAPWALSK